MNKNLKLVSILLVLPLMIALLITYVSAESPGGTFNNLTWNLDVATGVFTISGEGEMDFIDYSSPPWEGYNSYIKTVIIEDGVTNIGNYAFYRCTNLTDVTIAKSVIEVGYNAFSYCTALNSITFESPFTSINTNSSTIPNSATIYCFNNSGAQQYAEKNSKKFVSLGDADPNKAYASGTCGEDLTWAITGDFTLTISGMGNMTNYSTSSYAPWYPYRTYIKAAVVEEGVASMGSCALYNCTNLTNGVTFLSPYTEITGYNTIPSNTTVYGYYNSTAHAYANDNLKGLELLGVDSNTILNSGTCGDGLTWQLSSDGTFEMFGSGEIEDYTDPEAVPWSSDRILIKSVKLPEGLTKIGRYAFNGCHQLSSLTIPSTVLKVSENAIRYCSGLKDITFLSPITIIYLEVHDIPGETTIYGYNNSSAYSHANAYGKKFVSLGDADPNKAYATGMCGDNAAWKITGDFTLVISGTGDMFDYTSTTASPMALYRHFIDSVIIEDGITRIGDYVFSNFGCESITIADSVLSIGDYAFYYCVKLPTLTIPDSVTTIGDSAFRYCEKLESIKLSNNLTEIGTHAFYCCSELKSVTLPDSLTKVSNNLFYYCKKLENVYIPEGVTVIANSAFYNCTSLTNVTIPNSVKKIESNAFEDCIVLKSITIPVNVESVGYRAFDGCAGLTSIKFMSPITVIYDGSTTIPAATTIYGYNNSTAQAYANQYTRTFELFEDDPNAVFTSGTCGDGVTWKVTGACTLTISGTGDMSDYAKASETPWYAYASYLRHIVIEDGVTGIGDYAFSGCEYVTDVIIPDSVTSINKYAFENCTSLVDIEIPQGVTTIGERAFCDCSSITALTIPNGVTTIERYVFYGCSSLESVTIPDSVTIIGSYAFYNCSSLTSINIPDGVTNIYNYSFCNCKSLTSVTIPDSVICVWDYAFRNCTNLESITFLSPITEIDSSSSTISSTAVIYGYDNSTAHSYANSYSRTFISLEENSDIVLASGTCGENATWRLTGDYTLTISGTGAISGYNGISAKPWYDYRLYIKNVIIEDGVTEIRGGAFEQCSNLTNISIPNSVTNIDNYSFEECTSLSNITIPDSVKSIGMYAFNGCISLTNIVIPDSVISLDDYVFYNCKGLTSVVLGSGISYIDDRVFYNCNNLKDIYVLSNQTVLPYDSRYISSTSSYEYYSLLPESVTVHGWPVSAAKDFCDLYGHTFTELDSSYEKVIKTGECGYDATFTITNSGKLTISGEGGLYDYVAGQSGSNSVYGTSPWINNRYISSITVGEGITSIGAYNFALCDRALSVSLPSTIRSIETYAFLNCESLENIDLPLGVRNIKDYVFAGCTGLTSVYIPSKVTNLGSGVFLGCLGLEEINVDEFNSYYSDVDGVLFDKEQTTLLKYPQARLGETYVIPDTVTSVLSVGSIHLPGYNSDEFVAAFTACNNLKTVSVPSGVKGDLYFINCEILENVNVPLGVTNVSFMGCLSLKSVALPTGIAYADFSDCVSLIDVELSDTTTGVDFSNCSSLIKATIPATVRNVTFSKCSNLNEVTFEGNVNITQSVFEKCYRLEKVVFLNMKNNIDDVYGIIPELAIIHGYEGSTAQEYAKRYGYDFVSLGSFEIPGNLDGNDIVDNNDAIYLLYATIFGGEEYPINQDCDFDGNGVVDNNDAIYLLYHTIFGEDEYPLS